MNDWAPNCLIRPPTCSAITAPNGIATSAVGMIVTEAMNHACWMNSRVWNGRRNSPRPTSRPKANSLPAVPTGARKREVEVEDIRQAPVLMIMFSWNDPGGGVTPFSLHHSPGGRWLRRGIPLDGSCCNGMGGSGGSS